MEWIFVTVVGMIAVGVCMGIIWNTRKVGRIPDPLLDSQQLEEPCCDHRKNVIAQSSCATELELDENDFEDLELPVEVASVTLAEPPDLGFDKPGPTYTPEPSCTESSYSSGSCSSYDSSGSSYDSGGGCDSGGCD